MVSLVPAPFLVLCFGSLCVVNVFAGYIQESEVKAKNSTLELVHVIFRHGPRTPVNTYPNDPYINETFYPYGWGHLTNGAKQELFKLGGWLRKRYENILGSYYHNDLIHAQSSASPRTLMTMATVLAGMLPPSKTPMEWNKSFNWQPVPIYSEPLENDILLRMTASCPRYDQALEEVLALPEVQAELKAHEQIFTELSALTGMNVTGALDINSIFITFQAEQAYGLKLPEWSKNYFPEKMIFMAGQNYNYNAYTTEMKRIKGGPFLQKMFGEMQAKADGTLSPADRKVFMYCAHDWSITNILSALNVWNTRVPRFSAMAMFELHKNPETQEYYVQIYYKNKPVGKVEKLTIPGCEFQCPLAKLMQLTKEVLPDDTYENMCLAKSS